MRGRLLLLLPVCGFWLALAPANQTANPRQVEADEQKLKAANIAIDGPGLLEFIRSRTLTDKSRAQAELLIAQLGASSFKVREQAAKELIAKGAVVLELLRQGLNHTDLEVQRRCESCIQKIRERDHPPEVTAAVVRLIGVRKPDDAADALLALLPAVESDVVSDDIRDTLARLAVREGKADKALLAALGDKLADKRGAAGEALIRGGALDNHSQELRALLGDPNISVRFRAAVALVTAQERDAVLALIEMLPEATQSQAWQIEDLLLRLASGKSPPATSLGADESSRKICRDAWRAWWKENAARADLVALRDGPRLLGYTTMVLLDQNRVIEIDGKNNIRWQIDDLMFPLDIQVLDRDRVLIAEYQGHRITERTFKGQVLWQRPYQDPQMAQRLVNGNTFMASKFNMLEIDSGGKQVFNYNVTNDHGILKCVKAPTGEVTCLFEDGRVVRIDAMGKEVGGFRVDIALRLFGGRLNVLPNGNVLIPHNQENKVVEYDASGNVVWQIKVEEPIVATRLPNGNTLVTSMSQKRAVEFDRNGNEVWQYHSASRVTRALRR